MSPTNTRKILCQLSNVDGIYKVVGPIQDESFIVAPNQAIYLTVDEYTVYKMNMEGFTSWQKKLRKLSKF